MQSARISLSGLGAALANFKVACANHAQTTRPLYALSFHKASFLSKTLVCAIAFPWVLNQISHNFSTPLSIYMVNKKPCGLWRMVESMRFCCLSRTAWTHATPASQHPRKRFAKGPQSIHDHRGPAWWGLMVVWRNLLHTGALAKSHGLECNGMYYHKKTNGNLMGKIDICDIYRIYLSIWMDNFSQMKHLLANEWLSHVYKHIELTIDAPIYIYIHIHQYLFIYICTLKVLNSIQCTMDATPKSIAEAFDRWYRPKCQLWVQQNLIISAWKPMRPNNGPKSAFRGNFFRKFHNAFVHSFRIVRNLLCLIYRILKTRSNRTKSQIAPGLRHRFKNCTWENSFPTQPALSSKSVYRKGPLVKVAGHLKQQLFELHLRFSCKASQWKAQSPLNSVTVKRSLASGLQPIPFTGIPLWNNSLRAEAM